MPNNKITIRPEYSAQRRSHPPNPALSDAIEVLQESRGAKRLGKIADLGCGKLRHFRLLAPISDELFLVDTFEQLSATHRDGGLSYTVSEVAQQASRKGRGVHVMAIDDFAEARLRLDAVFCIAVFDVVRRVTRRAITEAVAHNLANEGVFVVIAPRNDSSIVRRCTKQNAYLDGHVFKHHGIHTFFHNFKTYDDVLNDCEKVGLFLLADLSRYRQVCLLFSPSARIVKSAG